MDLHNWRTQLRKGLLEAAILNLLRHREYHGYDIAKTLKQMKGLKIREGNIYPILARLQTDGLVATRSETSVDGPPRRYFKLTESGQQALADMNEHWDQLIDSMQNIRKGACP